MTLLSILLLVLFHPNYSPSVAVSKVSMPAATTTLLTIDSADVVIFDIDMITQVGNYIEIPVYLETDDIINALDFSMTINVANLIFDSVIDHTGELQFVAHMNPNDNKLRFTSNSFTPYPDGGQHVVSMRFQVVTSFVSRSDFEELRGYLNGESCSAEMFGKGIVLADEIVIVPEVQIRPNPASDVILINTETDSELRIYDNYGHHLGTHHLYPHTTNTVDVQALPRGSYSLEVVHKNHIVKTHRILLQ